MNDIVEIDLDAKSRSIFASAYYQFDRGLKIRLLNVPDCRDYSLHVEMCNVGDKVIKSDVLYNGNDVEIPEALLRDGREIMIYIFVKGEGWGKTALEITLSILRRPSR